MRAVAGPLMWQSKHGHALRHSIYPYRLGMLAILTGRLHVTSTPRAEINPICNSVPTCNGRHPVAHKGRQRACVRAVAGPIRSCPDDPEAVIASRIQDAASLKESRARNRQHSDKHAFYQ